MDDIQDFNKAIELDPNNASAYRNRGLANGMAGRHEEAIRDFDKAIELDPEDAGAYYNRGFAKERSGQREEAIRDYDRAIQIDSKYVGAYNNRGVIKMDLGQYGEATRDFDKVIELDPEHAGAYNNRNLVKYRLNKDKRQLKQKLKETIAETLDYSEILQSFNEAYEKAKTAHSNNLNLLVLATLTTYGFLAWYGFGYINDSDGNSPWSVIPFITIATLMLIPFYLAERSANKDKNNMLALREDIRTKKILTILSEHYTGDKNEALLKLFDHHTQSGLPALILGEKERSVDINIVDKLAGMIKKQKE